MPAQPLQQSLLMERLAEGGQWERVVEVGRGALAAEPDDPLTHRYLGLALVRLERFKEAAPHVKQLLAHEPDSAVSHWLAAQLAAGRRRPYRAVEHISEAVRLDPENAGFWYLKGAYHYDCGHDYPAWQAALKAQQLAPEDDDVANLIYLLNARQEPSRAKAGEHLQALEEALSLNPLNPYLHANLGTVHLCQLGDPGAAEPHFRRALENDPGNPHFRALLFRALREGHPVYRALNLPRRWARAIKRSWEPEGKSPLGLALTLLTILPGAALWLLLALSYCMAFWPLSKAYEYFTLSDIRAEAARLEPGVRPTGWRFGEWPAGLRLACFGLVLAAFWGGLFLLWDHPGGGWVTSLALLGAALGAAVLLHREDE